MKKLILISIISLGLYGCKEEEPIKLTEKQRQEIKNQADKFQEGLTRDLNK